MAYAFHEPQKLNEMSSSADLRAQADAMGLETEQWWES